MRIADPGLANEKIDRIIGWEIPRRRSEEILKDAGALRRHLVAKTGKRDLDVTDYFSAVGKVPSYVLPEPMSRKSGCADCAYCEGNLCGADDEATRTVKFARFKTSHIPSTSEEVNRIITGLFSDEPLPRHSGFMQRRMNDNISSDFGTELSKKQRQITQRSASA